MLKPFLSSDQQAVVVFWLRKSLGYWKRILVGFACILVGFFVQYYWYGYWYGIVGGFFLLFGGNLFLMVRGLDNRIRFGKYAPEAEWEKVDESKILEAEQIARKIEGWKRSILDATSGLGAFIVLVMFIILLGIFIDGLIKGDGAFLVLTVDAGLLLFPHWFTGKLSIITRYGLLLKLEVIKTLLNNLKDRLQDHQVEYFMLLKGKETKVPDDVKFCVKIQNQHPGFLGLYAQIVVNRGIYPYFYVVLVTQKGYGLHETFKNYTPPGNITKEYPVEEDVEVLVIRQVTTKTSGYHTGDSKIREIFLEGLELAETVAVK